MDPQSQTTPTSPPPAEPISDAAELEALLSKLEATVQNQIERLNQDDYDTFIEQTEAVAEMLHRVTSATAQLTHTAHESIQRIHALHQKLGLTLQARSAETGQQLQQLKRGRTGIQAYKNSGG